MLDNIQLSGVQSFNMWREPLDFVGDGAIVHVKLELVCRIAGPNRGRKALEIAFGETMDALEDGWTP